MMKRNIEIPDLEVRTEDWEEAEELIMKEIKKRSEELEIPGSLLPENMMKKLRQESGEQMSIVPDRKKKNRFLKQAAAIATDLGQRRWNMEHWKRVWFRQPAGKKYMIKLKIMIA